MGESVAEATLTAWLKDIGDTIDFDEAIVEIATDKVDSEVPSEKKGILIRDCSSFKYLDKKWGRISLQNKKNNKILCREIQNSFKK